MIQKSDVTNKTNLLKMGTHSLKFNSVNKCQNKNVYYYFKCSIMTKSGDRQELPWHQQTFPSYPSLSHPQNKMCKDEIYNINTSGHTKKFYTLMLYILILQYVSNKFKI